MSVFGAIVMYIMSMLSLFKLRVSEPNLKRSFMAPVYPLFPAIALIGAVVCLVTMIYYNLLVAEVFVGLMVLGYVYFLTTNTRRTEMLAGSASVGDAA
jgi:ethanolamine permease